MRAGTERFVKWVVAALATAAAFAVPTWICGVLLLPLAVKDPAIRWGLASALGVAMAALAALWGHGFATRPEEETGDREPPDPVVKASGVRAVAVGGSNSGTISTGDTAVAGQSPGQAGGRKPAAPRLTAAPAAGTVTGSGERSIAVGGDSAGILSTGDQHSAPS